MTDDRSLSVTDVNRELYARNAELAARNKTLSLVQAFSATTARALGVNDMLGELAQRLRASFAYPFVAFAVRDAHRHAFVWRSSAVDLRGVQIFPFDVVQMPACRLDDEKNVCVHAATTHRRATARVLSAVIPDIPHDVARAFAEATGHRSTLVFPMLADGEAQGVLVIGLDRAASSLARFEREMLESLLGLVSVALVKAQTYEHLQHTTGQLRVANRHLRELDAMKTEFLSIASHQLRTPLAVLKGYVGMLKSAMLGPLTEKQRETLGRMEGGTEQLIMLVNHLLDVSRIESNRLQVRIEPVDIRAVVESLVGFIRPKAEEKRLVLTCAAPDGVMMVAADIEKLKEIVMNLLDNAIKYTDEGSVRVSLEVHAGSARLAVADTGHGLTKEDQDKLFQKFATGSASRHVRTTTGLGLYVVRKLVEAMRGSVAAESAGAEKGSTFIVTLPLAARAHDTTHV